MAFVEVHSSNQSPTTSTASTLREMKNECEIKWEHIQDTHHRLASRPEKKLEVGGEKENINVKILQHKERRLRAELDILKSQDIEVVSKDPKFVEVLLKDDLKKTTEQLRETLAIIKLQRQELAGDIQRERKLLEEQKEIQRVLQEKIKVYEEENAQLKNSILNDLQTKKKEVNSHYLSLMKQLGTYLTQNFPKPTETDIVASQTSKVKSTPSYCSLLHLTELLMNRLFDSPHDPYIRLLPTYWPPYIELLLRYNIIQRHPDNCNLIRLVAYHL